MVGDSTQKLVTFGVFWSSPEYPDDWIIWNWYSNFETASRECDLKNPCLANLNIGAVKIVKRTEIFEDVTEPARKEAAL